MLPPIHKAVVAAFTTKPSLVNQLELRQTSGMSLKELQKEIRAKREAWEALSRRNADIADEFIESASAADLRKSLDFYESKEAYTAMAPWLLMLLKKVLTSSQKKAKRGGGDTVLELTIQIMDIAKELHPLSKDHFLELTAAIRAATQVHQKQRLFAQFTREKENLRIKLGILRTMYESLSMHGNSGATNQHQAVHVLVSRYQAPPFCKFLDVDELLSLISQCIRASGGGLCVSKPQASEPLQMPTLDEIDEFIKANLDEAAAISRAFGKNMTTYNDLTAEEELALFDLEDAKQGGATKPMRATKPKPMRKTRPQKRKST